MSRFVADEVASEWGRWHDRNSELGRTGSVKVCARNDGTTGVAVQARKFMVVFTPDEAVEIADALVDAVEAVNGQQDSSQVAS